MNMFRSQEFNLKPNMKIIGFLRNFSQLIYVCQEIFEITILQSKGIGSTEVAKMHC